LLCLFGLRAYFHQDRDTVAITCRQHRQSSSDHHIPSAFVPRYFSNPIRGSQEEIEFFVNFVSQVVGLPREQYRVVINSLRNFAHAFHILSHNIDLAYSLLVFSMESLSQSLDEYVPVWEDYHDEVRRDLDPILDKLSSGTAKDIKSLLLRSSHLKARRRFTEFVETYVEDSFFTDEAPEGYGTLRKYELTRALTNAYTMRSQYAHQLLPIQEQLRHHDLANWDVLRWKNQPYLTMAGLVRLIHHVIKTYVSRQAPVDRQKFEWRNELPGIVRMEMAPQYWVWQYAGFEPGHAAKKLSGFLSQLETTMLTNEPLTDLRELLAVYERTLPKAKKKMRLQMLSLYFLYNAIVPPEGKTPKHEKVFEKNNKYFNECTIETMLTRLLLGQEWQWEPLECANQWQIYLAQRFKEAGLSIPHLMEIAMLASIAQMFLKLEIPVNHKKYLNMAMLDAAGKHEVQKLLASAHETGEQLNYQDICDAAKKAKAQPTN
jgi:hypothetical protein